MDRSPEEQRILAEQIIQRYGNEPKMLDKLAVVARQAKESSQRPDICWHRLAGNSLDFGRVSCNSTFIDNVA